MIRRRPRPVLDKTRVPPDHLKAGLHQVTLCNLAGQVPLYAPPRPPRIDPHRHIPVNVEPSIFVQPGLCCKSGCINCILTRLAAGNPYLVEGPGRNDVRERQIFQIFLELVPPPRRPLLRQEQIAEPGPARPVAADETLSTVVAVVHLAVVRRKVLQDQADFELRVLAGPEGDIARPLDIVRSINKAPALGIAIETVVFRIWISRCPPFVLQRGHKRRLRPNRPHQAALQHSPVVTGVVLSNVDNPARLRVYLPHPLRVVPLHVVLVC